MNEDAADSPGSFGPEDYLAIVRKFQNALLKHGNLVRALRGEVELLKKDMEQVKLRIPAVEGG